MRIVNNVSQDLADVNIASSQMQTASEQVSSGKRINSPSDDPLGTQEAIADQASIDAIDSYTSAGNSASSVLSTADNVLNDITSKLTQAITTASGAQGTSVDTASRQAAASTLDGIADGLAADLNTQFQGSYLFSGTASNTPAYVQAADGSWSYQGNSATTKVEVDQGQQVSVSFNGQAIAQGSDPTDVLTALGNLATAVAAGDDTGISNGLTALQNAFNRASQAQGNLGADENTVTSSSTLLSSLKTTLTTQSSALTDTNMADAVTRLTQAQNAYQAALSAVSYDERESLLDYLPAST